MFFLMCGIEINISYQMMNANENKNIRYYIMPKSFINSSDGVLQIKSDTTGDILSIFESCTKNILAISLSDMTEDMPVLTIHTRFENLELQYSSRKNIKIAYDELLCLLSKFALKPEYPTSSLRDIHVS